MIAESETVTGDFEGDFIETCKRLGIANPPNVLKIPFPLPPLPTETTGAQSFNSLKESPQKGARDDKIEEHLPQSDDAAKATVAAVGSPLQGDQLESGLDDNNAGQDTVTTHPPELRCLQIDQNPEIPETVLPYLIGEESSIKALSLRMNKITDQGAKLIAAALKSNRVLTSLNLWGNRIGKEGAVDIAEALMELEKQRREQEEVSYKLFIGLRVLGSDCEKGKRIKSEEMLNKKDAPNADAKGQKKGAQPKAGKKADVAPAQKRTPDTGPTAANQQGGRKGTAPQSNPVPVPEDKKGGRVDKKGTSTAKGSKKTKVEETREEQEEVVYGVIKLLKSIKANPDVNVAVEPMFEHNGQWFVLGNRTLSCLNLSYASITEVGLRLLLDAILEQDVSAEFVPEGLSGLFRLSLQGNLFDRDSAAFAQLQTLLHARNPFIDQDMQGDKTQERKEEEESEEGNSVLEEES
ncbi:Leucine-rich repeat-containing protein 71 [Phlyctochytrium bullatum]|nr:Leucine-rich repeat-containing protein 71 [Phlyctochytrium bullatum]